MYMSSSPTKYPHKSMDPSPSLSHICSIIAFIAIVLQFLYVAPLPPITGKIPEMIFCSTSVFFSFPANFLHLCIIIVVPSLSALFVPICTNIYPPWPCPNAFSTRSVTCSILASVKQPTTSSPSLAAMISTSKVLHVMTFMRDE